MSSISFTGLGGTARAIAARAAEGGNAVEVTGRDQAKAKDLAAALGGARWTCSSPAMGLARHGAGFNISLAVNASA